MHLAIRIRGDISLTFASCLRSVSGAEILSPRATRSITRGVPVRAFYLGDLSRRRFTGAGRFTEDGSKQAKPKTEAPSPGKRENKERNPEQREWVVD